MTHECVLVTLTRLLHVRHLGITRRHHGHQLRIARQPSLLVIAILRHEILLLLLLLLQLRHRVIYVSLDGYGVKLAGANDQRCDILLILRLLLLLLPCIEPLANVRQSTRHIMRELCHLRPVHTRHSVQQRGTDPQCQL